MVRNGALAFLERDLESWQNRGRGLHIAFDSTVHGHDLYNR